MNALAIEYFLINGLSIVIVQNTLSRNDKFVLQRYCIKFTSAVFSTKKTEVKPLKTEKGPPKVPQREGKRNIMVVQTAKPRLNRRQTEKVKIKPSETETKPLKTPKKEEKEKEDFPLQPPIEEK